ncbi:MAG: hypothetical protein HPZ91_15475 [Lentisphaeria bacterium]|nr:hypothetical protein [Lentisphaeria bacterium]
MRKERKFMAMFAALAVVAGCATDVPVSADGIMPIGNLVRNGDFENELDAFTAHLLSGAKGGVAPEGFESATLLTLAVPAELHNTENYFAQTVPVDPAEPCRSYRLTYWLRYKVLAGKDGGAGVMASFLDATGKVIGRTSGKHLRRTEDTKNQWQAIDQIKDGWWDSYELEFTLPPGTAAIRLEAGLFRAAGSADFDRLILEPRSVPAAALAEASPIRAQVGTEIRKAHLSELLFGVNAEFRYPGITRGTLPLSDPASLEREFATALHSAGVRVLRFPGGMPTHQYFTEGPQAQAKLFKLFPNQSYYFRNMGYPLVHDVLEFCRRNNFEMLFEVNTMFFADENGDVWPISDNKYKPEKPELYTKKRITEAAAALDRFIGTLPSPDAIRYWEIGNEEFALMPLKEYAEICNAFIRVIKARNPEAVITVTGNTWPAALCKALAEKGVMDEVAYLSAHYPWGDHFRPEPGGEKDLERFVCGTLHWGVNTAAHLKMVRDAGFGKVKMAGNETSVFKFHTWDAHRVIYTPAHGLLFAANWMEAMKLNDMDVLTFHDLESPFFGMILSNQFYNPATGRFELLKPEQTSCPKGAPERYFLRDRYLVLPSGYAMKQLSRHCGLNVLDAPIASPAASKRVLFDLLASEDGGRLIITAVNRGAVARHLTLDVSGHLDTGIAMLGGIRWPVLDELPRPPIELSGTIPVTGGTITLTLQPFSITRLEMERK